MGIDVPGSQFYLFVFLITVWAVNGSLVSLILSGPGTISNLILSPILIIRRFPFSIIIFIYFMIESLYVFHNYIVNILDLSSTRANLTLISLGMLYLCFLGVVLFARREPTEVKRISINLLILGLSCLISFIGFCYAYALIIVGDSYVQRHSFYNVLETDPLLGMKLKSNLKDYAIYFSEEHRWAPLSTDANGMRNVSDVSSAPIAGIGDSLFFGIWVSDNELWSAVLSRELNVPVANYSFVGYHMQEYNVLAQKYANSGSHSLVIYGIYANDLPDFGVLRFSKRDIALRQQILRYWRSPIDFTITDFFIRRSPAQQIRNLLQNNSTPDVTTMVGISTPHNLPPYCELGMSAAGYYPEEMDLVLASRIDQAISFAKAGGYRLLFVLIPSKESVYSDELVPLCGIVTKKRVLLEQLGYINLCKTIRAKGQLCYNMTADIQDVAADEMGPLYYGIDGHWTPLGHLVFARLIKQFILRNNLLDR